MNSIEDEIPKNDNQLIYLAMDHLRTGTYKLKITLDNRVVKTVSIKKK